MDYISLRQEGIRHLERLAGGRWTDFNVHDPGITILEQLCYAITDLGYRIGHEIPDLLADGGADPYASFYPPAEILTCEPVTPADLRRAVLDVEGVKNAWIEPDAEQEVPFHHHPGRQEIHLEAEPPETEPVRLRGLYRVVVETSDLAGVDGTAVRAAVARRLHRSRNLGEDITDVRVLEPQSVRVAARVQIGAVDDAEQVLLRIFERLAEHISPSVAFAPADEAHASGRPDEIYEGPLLDHGFLDPERLPRGARRTTLNGSDLIRVIMEVPGIRAVRTLAMSTGTGDEPWILELAPERAPRLDLAASAIALEKEDIAVGVDVERVIAAYNERRRSAHAAVGRRRWTPPAGRDRDVGSYLPVEHQFPALYGIGEMGLPASAAAERKARARQLRAYLTFFDQLLANLHAQLAHARDLYSFDGEELRTYFARAVEGSGLDPARLRELTAGQDSPERKNRFLNHLLARFAERFTDYSLALFDAMPAASASQAEKLARDKQAFLRRYPRISAGRGTGFDYLRPRGEGNLSGLEERVRLKLGLDASLGEEFVLVEHILLRPMTEDQRQLVPLLAASRYQDPYSLQVSFVFPAAPERFTRPGFQRFIEQTIREETPAHLTPYVHWLAADAWIKLGDAYREWLRWRREYWSAKLGVDFDGG